jgi:TonB family protein
MKTWRRRAIAWFLVGALALAMAPRANARETLASARELYAAAAYSDALMVLDGLLKVNPPREERQSIELYRVLCLVALGRKTDADRAIDAMIVRDPTYRPAGDDTPPRLRSAFVDARRRLLPTIVQAQYADAKAAFDRKEFSTAADGFGKVLAALADPDIGQAAGQPPLADLRTLADGFRDLSTKAGAPQPAPVVAQPEMPVPGRIYGAEDRNVVPPMTIRQSVPPHRGHVTRVANGVVEVLIDATGAVESARMAVPLNGAYDALVLSAAKRWQYEPAKVNGVPVKFVKRVKVTLTPAPRE